MARCAATCMVDTPCRDSIDHDVCCAWVPSQQMTHESYLFADRKEGTETEGGEADPWDADPADLALSGKPQSRACLLAAALDRSLLSMCLPCRCLGKPTPIDRAAVVDPLTFGAAGHRQLRQMAIDRSAGVDVWMDGRLDAFFFFG